MGLLVAAFLVLSTALPTSGAATQPSLKLAPCRLPGLEREARCGTHEVFENRASGSGRKIALRVVVLPARSAPAAPDPVVFFEGGPGVSVVDSGPDLAQEIDAVLQHRDLLLVDARGTGGSHPLGCPRPEKMLEVEEALDTFMDPVAVRRCHTLLAKDNDLTQYTTDATVDDVDEVRAALGYEKVNLMGASYGTRAALVYLRRHPGSVRTVQISSVLPTDARIPTFLAGHTQAAFERVVADCAAEAPCHAAFPDPRADLDAVLNRLAAEPAKVTVRDGDDKERMLRLSRNGAVQTVRYLLYRPDGVRELPLVLRRAAAGDLAPLAQRAYDIASAVLASPPDGLYLSVTCAEDVAFANREEGARLAAGTFVGDLRLRQQIAACAEWPSAKIPPSFLEPVRSEVPALIVAGESDPTTPREWAEKVASALPRSRVMVVPGGAHAFYGLEGTGCLDRLIADFVIRGSAEGLDLEGCRKAIRRPPFAKTLEAETPGD
jgi:pimeloyl-ACP methyl ester carboxylesterase